MSIKTRIIVCICILSVAISLIYVFATTDAFKKDNEYTRMDDAVMTVNGIYYAHNNNSNGFVFRMDRTGKVLNMADARAQGELWVEKVEFTDGTVHVLYSADRVYNDELTTVYHIMTYDTKLKAQKSSYRFVPGNGGIVKGFDVEGDSYYLTYISSDGMELNVYEVLEEDLVDLSNANDLKDEDIESLDSIVSRTSSGETFYADACYTSSVLAIRRPSDKPEGVFAINPVIVNAVSRMKLSFSQYLSVYKNIWVVWFACIVIWFIFLFITIRLLKDRNRMVYEAVLMEGLLFIILGGCFSFAGMQYKQAIIKSVNNYVEMGLTRELAGIGPLENVPYYDEDFYESEEYKRIQNSLSDFVNEAGNYSVFSDVFIMRLSDRMVMLGVSGMNQEDAALQYGSVIEEVRKGFDITNSRVTKSTVLEGQDVYVSGVCSGGKEAKYALVGVSVISEDMGGFWTDFRLRLLVFVLCFLLISGVILFIIYLRAKDLKEFEYVISEAAMGRTTVRVPETEAKDMRSMWRSLSELVKKIDEINYSRFRIFEAYYRFAPKNIETVMGKDSITDVKNGDVTQTQGTLMLVTSSEGGVGEKQIHALNNIIYFMEEYADSGEGILVSEDSALSMLQFLFLKNDTGISARATQFLHRNASDKESGTLSVFLYHASFMYGIAGTVTQSLTYLAFEYARELENYARWFKRLRLALVITEEVKNRDNPGELRYIGYILLGRERRKVMLYEVLDACTARERQIKLVNKEKFEATLELFYERNFYLARNQFSELLKELPDDEMAKWYLFESEKYLNDAKVGDDFGHLRVDNN